MDGIDIGFKVEAKIYLHALDGTEIAFNPERTVISKDGDRLIVKEGDGEKSVCATDTEEDVVDAINKATVLKMVALDAIHSAVSEMDSKEIL